MFHMFRLMFIVGMASELEYNWHNSSIVRRRWTSAIVERFVINSAISVVVM